MTAQKKCFTQEKPQKHLVSICGSECSKLHSKHVDFLVVFTVQHLLLVWTTLKKRILVATLVYLKIAVYSPFADHSQGLYTARAKQMVQTWKLHFLDSAVKNSATNSIEKQWMVSQ